MFALHYSVTTSCIKLAPECSGGLLRSAHVRDENLVSTCALGVLLALSGHKLSSPMAAFADAVGGKADMASASQNVRFWHLADIPSCAAHVRFRG